MFHAPIIYYWIEILYPRYIWRLRDKIGITKDGQSRKATYYDDDV